MPLHYTKIISYSASGRNSNRNLSVGFCRKNQEDLVPRRYHLDEPIGSISETVLSIGSVEFDKNGREREEEDEQAGDEIIRNMHSVRVKM